MAHIRTDPGPSTHVHDKAAASTVSLRKVSDDEYIDVNDDTRRYTAQRCTAFTSKTCDTRAVPHELLGFVSLDEGTGFALSVLCKDSNGCAGGAGGAGDAGDVVWLHAIETTAFVPAPLRSDMGSGEEDDKALQPSPHSTEAEIGSAAMPPPPHALTAEEPAPIFQGEFTADSHCTGLMMFRPVPLVGDQSAAPPLDGVLFGYPQEWLTGTVLSAADEKVGGVRRWKMWQLGPKQSAESFEQ